MENYITELQDIGPRCSGQQEKAEERLMAAFPPGNSTFLTTPAVICDQDGLALVWYLPSILSRKRQVSDLVIYSKPIY